MAFLFGTTVAFIQTDDYSFVGKVNNEFPQIFPKPSWVEHSLDDIWKSIKLTIVEAMEKFQITSDQIHSIGITNQRETTCAF